MILKNIDSKDESIKILEELLNESTNEKQKYLIESDLKNLKNGYQKEKENAYFIDFEFKNSKNVHIIHDLRLEHNGRVAQIDHLLLNRFGIEVLESKSFSGIVTIKSDNSLEVKYKEKIIAQPNPLEQAKRHELVVRELLKDNNLLTNIIGLNLVISSKVLFNPNTVVSNDPMPNDFVKADNFFKNRIDSIDNMGIVQIYKSAFGLQKIDNILNIANFLISQHKPLNFDYRSKYKIKKEKIEEVQNNKLVDIEIKCPKCDGVLVKRELKNKKYQDKYSNNEFLGCSNYPKCRHSQTL
jgi:hypothetical protein